jgi:hypothetical protein
MHEEGRRSGALHILVHPVAAFLRNYVLRRGVFDGTVGLTISLTGAYSVFLKFAKLWELQRRPAPSAMAPFTGRSAANPQRSSDDKASAPL